MYRRISPQKRTCKLIVLTYICSVLKHRPSMKPSIQVSSGLRGLSASSTRGGDIILLPGTLPLNFLIDFSVSVKAGSLSSSVMYVSGALGCGIHMRHGRKYSFQQTNVHGYAACNVHAQNQHLNHLQLDNLPHLLQFLLSVPHPILYSTAFLLK